MIQNADYLFYLPRPSTRSSSPAFIPCGLPALLPSSRWVVARGLPSGPHQQTHILHVYNPRHPLHPLTVLWDLDSVRFAFDGVLPSHPFSIADFAPYREVGGVGWSYGSYSQG